MNILRKESIFCRRARKAHPKLASTISSCELFWASISLEIWREACTHIYATVQRDSMLLNDGIVPYNCTSYQFLLQSYASREHLLATRKNIPPPFFSVDKRGACSRQSFRQGLMGPRCCLHAPRLSTEKKVGLVLVWVLLEVLKCTVAFNGNTNLSKN